MLQAPGRIFRWVRELEMQRQEVEQALAALVNQMVTAVLHAGGGTSSNTPPPAHVVLQMGEALAQLRVLHCSTVVLLTMMLARPAGIAAVTGSDCLCIEGEDAAALELLVQCKALVDGVAKVTRINASFQLNALVSVGLMTEDYTRRERLQLIAARPYSYKAMMLHVLCSN